MMLDDTPPPTLNAAALRTFEELGFYILCLKSPLGSFLEGESILSSQGTFLCPSAFVKQWALGTPCPQVRIFPQDTGKWVLACGLGKAWCLGHELVPCPGIFPLGTFSQGRCQALQE